MGLSTEDAKDRGDVPEQHSPEFEKPLYIRANDAEQRLRRIQEFREDAYRDVNAKKAALGGMNADLFEIEAHLAQSLQQAMDGGSGTMEEIDLYRPTIDLILRLSRQSAQITQVELLVSKQDARPSPKPR